MTTPMFILILTTMMKKVTLNQGLKIVCQCLSPINTPLARKLRWQMQSIPTKSRLMKRDITK